MALSTKHKAAMPVRPESAPQNGIVRSSLPALPEFNSSRITARAWFIPEQIPLIQSQLGLNIHYLQLDFEVDWAACVQNARSDFAIKHRNELLFVLRHSEFTKLNFNTQLTEIDIDLIAGINDLENLVIQNLVARIMQNVEIALLCLSDYPNLLKRMTDFSDKLPKVIEKLSSWSKSTVHHDLLCHELQQLVYGKVFQLPPHFELALSGSTLSDWLEFELQHNFPPAHARHANNAAIWLRSIVMTKLREFTDFIPIEQSPQAVLYAALCAARTPEQEKLLDNYRNRIAELEVEASFNEFDVAGSYKNEALKDVYRLADTLIEKGDTHLKFAKAAGKLNTAVLNVSRKKIIEDAIVRHLHLDFDQLGYQSDVSPKLEFHWSGDGQFERKHVVNDENITPFEMAILAAVKQAHAEVCKLIEANTPNSLIKTCVYEDADEQRYIVADWLLGNKYPASHSRLWIEFSITDSSMLF